MKLDLHLHTSYSSDSLNGLETIVKKTRKLGIMPAITDHNNVDAHEKLKEMKFEFIPGEEITSLQGDVLAFYINEAIPKKLDYFETVDRIGEQGGLACLPHMYDPGRTKIDEAELGEKADIIEVYNARCPEWCNKKARDFAEKNDKYASAGSDSHLGYEIGNAYVETKDFDISEPKEFLKALKKGKIIGSPTLFIPGLPTMAKFAKKVFGL